MMSGGAVIWRTIKKERSNISFLFIRILHPSCSPCAAERKQQYSTYVAIAVGNGRRGAAYNITRSFYFVRFVSTKQWEREKKNMKQKETISLFPTKHKVAGMHATQAAPHCNNNTERFLALSNALYGAHTHSFGPNNNNIIIIINTSISSLWYGCVMLHAAATVAVVVKEEKKLTWFERVYFFRLFGLLCMHGITKTTTTRVSSSQQEFFFTQASKRQNRLNFFCWL